MLLSFSVENFRSIKEKSTLSLVAAPLKDNLDNVYFLPGSQSNRVLKSCAIVGANSSGKSNIFKALSFAKHVVQKSVAEFSHLLSPFRLLEGYEKKSTSFDFVFEIDGDRYRYGFSILDNKVTGESLTLVRVTKEESIFLRSSHGFAFGGILKKDLSQKLDLFAQMTRPDNLFLRVLADYNYHRAISIVQWFDYMVDFSNSTPEEWANFGGSLMRSSDYYSDVINKVIKSSALGIDGVKPVQIINSNSLRHSFSADFLKLIADVSQSQFLINTIHNKLWTTKGSSTVEYFELFNDESSGTIKLFTILAPIVIALNKRSLLLIDELDASLHSHLIDRIFELFNKNSNSKIGSQLLFTSHNTKLLKSSLRRDQVVLCNKDDHGATTFKSLYESVPLLRNDASIEKDYLSGKYKGVPKFGGQINLFDDL